MAINLGNVAGLIKSTTPPSKTYVIWGKILNPSFPDIVELYYFDSISNAWTLISDSTTNYWLKPAINNTTTVPPASPAEGDRYLIPAGASGVWSGKTDKVATYKGGAWQYTTPSDGYIISVRTEANKLYDYRGVYGLGGFWGVNDFQVPIAPGSYIPSTEKASPLGVATLDGSAKIPIAQLGELPFSPSNPASWPAGTDTVAEALEYVRTLTSSFAPGWQVGGNTVGAVSGLGSLDNYDIAFIANSIEGFRLTTGGNLGVGLTSGIDSKVTIKNSANGKALRVINNSNATVLEIAEVLGVTSFVMNLGLDANGDTYYRNSGKLNRLPIGVSNKVLKSNGVSPIWGDIAWGEIAGSLASQSDLQTSLNDKASISGSYTNPSWITTLAASKITGVLNISNIPAAAIETVFVYAGVQTLPENAGLTTANVQTGDIVKMNSTGLMYIVTNDAALNSAASYEVFLAGTAASVPFTGITGLPTTLAGYGITNGVPNTRNINTTAPITGGGSLNADLTIAMAQASGSVNGFLSSADWTTFNNKQNSGLSYLLASGGTLTGPNTITGSNVNTLKYVFPGLLTTAVDGAGIWLANTTNAASSGTQQNSPSLVWEGQFWETTGGTSKSIKINNFISAIGAGANPQAMLKWQVSINNGAYTDLLTLATSGGVLTVSSLSASGIGGFNTLSSSTIAHSNPTSSTVTLSKGFTSGVSVGNQLLIDSNIVVNAGSLDYRNISITPTYNFSGSHSSGKVTGVLYNPVLTGLTGVVTNIAFHAHSGSLVMGHTTLTSNTTRVQIRAIGSSGNISTLWEDSTGVQTAAITDDGRLTLGNFTVQTGVKLEIRAIGTTFSTFGLVIKDSANVNLYRFGDDGSLRLGAASSPANFGVGNRTGLNKSTAGVRITADGSDGGTIITGSTTLSGTPADMPSALFLKSILNITGTSIGAANIFMDTPTITALTGPFYSIRSMHGSLWFTQGVINTNSSNLVSALRVDAGAHTLVNDEVIDFRFNGNRAVSYALNGTIARQAFTIFEGASALSGSVATTTITHAYTVYIGSLPAPGSNLVITNRWALGVQGNLRVEGSRISLSALPTSSAGLVAGDLWNNAGVVNIV